MLVLFGKQYKDLERSKFMTYIDLAEELRRRPARNYSIKDAERLADRVLEIGGLGECGSTPVVNVAKEFGFSTYKENLSGNIAGNIYVGEGANQYYKTDKVIVVGSSEELFHQRFIIAHELGHYLMDYLGNPEYTGGTKLFMRTYPKNNHNSAEEQRADRFAAELLMPEKLFLREYIKASKRFNDKRYIIPYLSTFFRTKKSSIERRIVEVIH